MKIFEYIERINLLHKLINEKRTGTLAQLAIRMKLSKSGMCRVIEDLKLKGAPIVYSRQLNSYFYSCNYVIKIQIEFKQLNVDETIKINAGQYSQSKIIETFSFVAFFVQRAQLS